MKVTIVCAALRVGLVTISHERPKRHCDLLRYLYGEVLRGLDPKHEVEQGFLTSENEFVGRVEAARIAVESGQVERLKWPPELYSEDLW